MLRSAHFFSQFSPQCEVLETYSAATKKIAAPDESYAPFWRLIPQCQLRLAQLFCLAALSTWIAGAERAEATEKRSTALLSVGSCCLRWIILPCLETGPVSAAKNSQCLMSGTRHFGCLILQCRKAVLDASESCRPVLAGGAT